MIMLDGLQMNSFFLTDKPVLYVANMSEEQLANIEKIESYQNLKK